jgi:nicotinate-nucleotide adenylyltransferase
MSHKPRLGVFGGAFDPPHIAHLALAQHAIEQFGLQQLRIIPTGDAWHKDHALTASPHRLAMTRLAFESMPQVHVDDREINRAGATYTYDTLLELKAEHPDEDLFLFIGADQANAFKTWHRWQDILKLATLVVAQRGGAAQWHNAVSPDVQRLDMPSLKVSATDIRAHYAQHAVAQPPFSKWLPASVQHYIEQHSLYRLNR